MTVIEKDHARLSNSIQMTIKLEIKLKLLSGLIILLFHIWYLAFGKFRSIMKEK